MCCFRWCGRQLCLRNMPISGVNLTPRTTAVYASDPALPRRPQDSLPPCLLGFGRTRLALASSYRLPIAPRIRLSDKTSRLHPRRAAAKLCQTYEPEVPVEVREWIAAALASPDVVLGSEPPAQPHSRVVVERAIRFAGGSDTEVIGPSAKRAVQHIDELCGLLPGMRSVGQRVDLFDHALDALL